MKGLRVYFIHAHFYDMLIWIDKYRFGGTNVIVVHFFISFDSVSCVGWCECTGADIDISQFLVPFFDNVCSLGDFIGKVKYLIAFNLREGVLFCPHTSTGRKFQNLIKFILTKKISPFDSFVFTSWWAWWIDRVEIPRFFFVRI